jgi:hypothetical protein
VEIVLGKPEPAPVGFEPHPVAWVLTATASLATAGFVTLAVVGKTKQDELDECVGHCDIEDVRVMRQLYLGADISLGVAVAAAVALAGYFAVDTQLSPREAGYNPFQVSF